MSTLSQMKTFGVNERHRHQDLFENADRSDFWDTVNYAPQVSIHVLEYQVGVLVLHYAVEVMDNIWMIVFAKLF